MVAFNHAFEVDPAAPSLIVALRGEKLPILDLGKPNQMFCRLGKVDEPSGFVGIELEGSAALLRSLGVLPAPKGRGYGAELVSIVAAGARQKGIEELWLLTRTAKPFFEHLGWHVSDRGSAPEMLATSVGFASLFPSSARCMSLTLT